MQSFEILCGITAVVLAIYYFLTSTFDFWKSRGVSGPRPIPGMGNFKDVLFNKKFTGDYVKEIYDTYKNEPLIGIFMTKTPILIVKDLDLIKNILIKDFSDFADRGYPDLKKVEPLSQHLFALEPKRWRPLRMRLSPVFTSGKLKEMFSLISECADHLILYMEKIASKNEPVECRELMAKYMTDVIGTCAFGIEMNALSNENSEFRKMGRKIFNPTWTNVLRLRLKQFCPQLYEMLGYILSETEITKFFTRVIVETMNYREMNNVTRHDFIDILLELKKHPNKLGDDFGTYLCDRLIYIYPANTNLMHTETLRKYPPVTFLLRQSMSSYTFDGTKVSIPKNQKVWIPIYAIQRDSDIYPKPDVFDPERFCDDAVQSRHPMTYLPFGDGPRNCIGARFGVYQTKIGLIKALRNYKFETCEKTPIPYVNNPKTALLSPKDGLHLKIIKINRT
ncbi:PREDICTED: cytochrome P450 6j1-like [Trachymyrmex septentrionalis]|uniref:cytochrome P450 6j1-like n=1 Tax=Trachymyrmex septentrionalis TaxID=34720 RepID=UPI00084F5633|nr:PREDICTED: cytochrome P450 6j1-like [Trachymyrmex septentrionalis]